MSTYSSPVGRRGRARWVGAAALLWPVLEIALLVAVWRTIGGAATLLLLAAGAVAGALALARVGRGGGSPAQTALLVPAGLLLIVPGFVSDAAGLVLLVPAVRQVLAARLGDAVLRNLGQGRVRVVSSSRLSSRVADSTTAHTTVVDTTVATDTEPGPPPRCLP